jgi:tetratricopeptide (TPR) repeat protein
MQQPDIWTRIRQGRFARIIAVYLGISWVVLQVTNELRDALSLPAWVSPVALLLLVIGLVIISATAWVQGQVRRPAVSDQAADSAESPAAAPAQLPQGLARHLTWQRSVTGGVIAFSLLFGFAGLYVVVMDRGRSFAPTEAMAGVAPALAVMPFSVSGTGLDVWREGMVDLMATNLDGVGGLRTTDSRTVLARWREVVRDKSTPDLETILKVARAAAARYALVGNAVGLGTNVRLSAVLYEVESGDKLGDGQAEGPADSVLTLVDRLSVDVLKGMLGGRTADVLPTNRRAAALTTSSLPALKSYLEGEALFRRSDFSGAMAALERAVTDDTTFALAYYRLSDVYGWAENISSAKAEAAAERAVRYIDRLPSRDSLLVRGAHALEHGTLHGFAPLQEAVRQYPDDPDAWFLLGDSYFHLGPQALLDPLEGLEHFRRAVALDPSFAPYQIHLVDMAVAQVDTPRAVQLLEEYGRLAPNSEFTHANRLAADLLFGDAPARARAVAALDTAPTLIINDITTVSSTPRSLQMRQQVLEELRRRSDAPGRALPTLLQTLVDRGRFRSARALLPALPAAQRPYQTYALHWHGVELSPEELAVLTVTATDTLPAPLLAKGAYAAEMGRGREVELAKSVAAAAAGRATDDEFSRAYRGVVRALEAHTLWKQGRAAAAVPILEQLQKEVTGLGPAGTVNTLTRVWLAELHAELNRPEEALRYLATLNITEARFRRAVLYEKLGRVDDARREYANCLIAWSEADEGFAKVAQAREALSRLQADHAK